MVSNSIFYLNQKDQIYLESDEVLWVYFLMKGEIRTYRSHSRTGKKVTLQIIKENQFFGYHEVFLGEYIRRNGVSVISRNATIERYHIEDFVLQLSQNLDLFYNLFECSLNYENQLLRRFDKMHSFTMKKKVAWMLMEVARAQEGDTDKLYIENYTHQLLGEYAGTSRQAITTSLSDFRRLGILEYDRNRITIDKALMKYLIGI